MEVSAKYDSPEEGKYENELLILTPITVKTQLQRQHISKDILEYGFDVAKRQIRI